MGNGAIRVGDFFAQQIMGRVALHVQVDDQRLFVVNGTDGRQITSNGRFPHAAFLIEYDPAHDSLEMISCLPLVDAHAEEWHRLWLE